MTAVRIRNKENVASGSSRSWNEMFPSEQVTSQQSLMFMKKLLAVSLSNITYLRAMFPEHAYGDRGLDDLRLKILKDDTFCPGAKEVIKWIKGCFDAIDRQYLRQIILGVFSKPEDQETLIESYSFRFTYNHNMSMTLYRNEDKIAESHSMAETKKATISLLRTIIILVQTMKPLPENSLLTMKLFYYDDVTPPDYEPPGFQPAQSDKFSYETETVKFKAGDVSTPFHSMKVHIRCDDKTFPDIANKKQNSQNIDKSDASQQETKEQKSTNDSARESPWIPEAESMVTHPDLDRNSLEYQDDDLTQPMQCDEVLSRNPDPPESHNKLSTAQEHGKDNKKLDDDHSNENDEETAEDLGVRCPCGINEDDGLMILCAVCKHWQHALCFKILNENGAPETHICNKCAHSADTDLQVTDPQLSDLNDHETQTTCLWRRTLSACTEMTKMGIPLLMRRLGIDSAVADSLVNRLQKEGYVKVSSKGKRYGKEVDQDHIRKHGIPKYFSNTKKANSKNTLSNSKERQLHKPLSRKKDKEIDSLAKKTESLSVDTNKSTKKEEQLESDDAFRGPQTRGRKRTKSHTSDSQSYDICSSQDTHENTACKRQKNSKPTLNVVV